MGRKYKNPPITEALCEFRFEPDPEWDLVIPGYVYEAVKAKFPKRRQLNLVEIEISGPGEAAGQFVRPHQPADRVQFWNEAGTAVVQVGPHLLVVNQLKPYHSWQAFLPLIEEVFQAYRRVAKPKKLERVGLRYINRIEFSEQLIKLEDYFDFYPFVGQGMPQDFGLFSVGIQIPFEEFRDILKVQLANARGAAPNTQAITLDLDYFLADPGKASLESALEWAETAHRHIEEVFEGAITDKLRQRFEEEGKE